MYCKEVPFVAILHVDNFPLGILSLFTEFSHNYDTFGARYIPSSESHLFRKTIDRMKKI